MRAPEEKRAQGGVLRGSGPMGGCCAATRELHSFVATKEYNSLVEMQGYSCSFALTEEHCSLALTE